MLLPSRVRGLFGSSAAGIAEEGIKDRQVCSRSQTGSRLILSHKTQGKHCSLLKQGHHAAKEGYTQQQSNSLPSPISFFCRPYPLPSAHRLCICSHWGR